MSPGQLPIALILFGMIALFLVLRLRSILGKRQGFEGVPEIGTRNARAPVIEGRAEPPPPTPRKMPEAASPTGQALASMKRHRPAFRRRHLPLGRGGRLPPDRHQLRQRRP